MTWSISFILEWKLATRSGFLERESGGIDSWSSDYSRRDWKCWFVVLMSWYYVYCAYRCISYQHNFFFFIFFFPREWWPGYRISSQTAWTAEWKVEGSFGQVSEPQMLWFFWIYLIWREGCVWQAPVNSDHLDLAFRVLIFYFSCRLWPMLCTTWVCYYGALLQIRLLLMVIFRDEWVSVVRDWILSSLSWFLNAGWEICPMLRSRTPFDFRNKMINSKRRISPCWRTRRDCWLKWSSCRRSSLNSRSMWVVPPGFLLAI